MTRARFDERGVAAVFVAVAIAALLGVVGLVLNVGYRLDTRSQLQNAADAAALAGARELDGTLVPITAGLPGTQAISFAGRHVSGADVQVAIGRTDVQLGHWDPFAANPWTAFTPLTPSTAEEAWNANAVRVLDGREARRGSALGVWLSAFLGNKTSMDVTAEAVAVNGGPCDVECPTMPFVFSDCLVPQNFQDKCDTIVTSSILPGSTNPDPNDSMGFTSLDLDVPASTPVFNDILKGQNCTTYTTHTNEEVPVSNGSNLVPLCTNLAPWVGKESLVAVIHDTCPPRFNQTALVSGFATVQLLGTCGCSAIPPPPGYLCGGGIKRVFFKLLCQRKVQPTDRVGCGFFGTGVLEPKLVR